MVLRIGSISVQENSYAMVINSKLIDLTPAEFHILWRLAKARGETVSSEQLQDYWKDNTTQMIRALKSRVFALRRKLGQYAGQLVTVRGAGYRLVESAPRAADEVAE